MVADYHIHTSYCGHAKGTVEEYIESAIALGLPEIGFADHLGRYYLTAAQRRRYGNWGMDERTLKRYVDEIIDLRELYGGRIRIALGLEIDFVEGGEHLLKPILDRFPFDYLLGSIHCLPRFGWKHLASYSRYADTAAIYREYFHVLRSAMQSGLFNSIAHPDFIWRYIAWPRSEPAMPIEKIAGAAAAAAENGVALEINANGFLWSQANRMESGDPFSILIEECSRRKVAVSLGSDAHEPTMVGNSFVPMVAALRQRNILTVARFFARELHCEPLT